jgi:predicted RNase H-like HicB family nuclease
MRFLIRIYRDRDNYSAMVPDLPGCVAAGDSIEEVRELITQAISLHLEMVIQSGEKTPKPSDHLDFVVAHDSAEEFCTWVEVNVAQMA